MRRDLMPTTHQAWPRTPRCRNRPTRRQLQPASRSLADGEGRSHRIARPRRAVAGLRRAGGGAAGKRETAAMPARRSPGRSRCRRPNPRRSYCRWLTGAGSRHWRRPLGPHRTTHHTAWTSRDGGSPRCRRAHLSVLRETPRTVQQSAPRRSRLRGAASVRQADFLRQVDRYALRSSLVIFSCVASALQTFISVV